VHIELAAPRCVIRTGFAVVLLQADLLYLCSGDWLCNVFVDHVDVCSNHLSPLALRRPGSHFVTLAPRLIRLRSALGGSFVIC
jgi:hypothetical protein